MRHGFATLIAAVLAALLTAPVTAQPPTNPSRADNPLRSSNANGHAEPPSAATESVAPTLENPDWEDPALGLPPGSFEPCPPGMPCGDGRQATPLGPMGFGGNASGGGPFDHGPSGVATAGHAGPVSMSGMPRLLNHFDLRHSSTHGRAMGPGKPLRGTSWKNRPFWLSFDAGALLMLGGVADGVEPANDTFAALGVGWDFDHYWGATARVGWSTPELLNTNRVASTNDDLFIGDFTLLYYPWGDSRTRPYYRAGIGLTDISYAGPTAGSEVGTVLATLPFGVGLKHQMSRFTTIRFEVMNHLAIGQGGTDTLNNVTLTAGLEWRFGGRPEGYWAWAPRGGGW